MKRGWYKKLAPYLTHSIVADFSDEDTIRQLNLQELDVVVIAIGDNLKAKLLSAMVLKGITCAVHRGESIYRNGK